MTASCTSAALPGTPSGAPELLAVDPNAAIAGSAARVVLRGRNLNPGYSAWADEPRGITVVMGELQATVVSYSSGGTDLTVDSPPGLGVGIHDVTVETPRGRSTRERSFQVVSP